MDKNEDLSRGCPISKIDTNNTVGYKFKNNNKLNVYDWLKKIFLKPQNHLILLR